MLNLVYKIISKLIANKMKLAMPQLIDSQQIGFIAGRNIVDNILTFKVAKEFAQKKKLLAILLMMDFMKAFDQLDHVFIYDILHALGFIEFFIHLIMGLVRGGASKIHVNGLFLGEFSLDQGVRQGCPMSSLLFALSSQPLIALLKKKAVEGMLRGIQLDAVGQSQLLCQLFVDDTSLYLEMSKDNFKAAMEVIATYERISGAKLNLEKSMIVQLDDSPEPAWLR